MIKEKKNCRVVEFHGVAKLILVRSLQDSLASILTLSSPSQQRPGWPLAMKFNAHGFAVKSSNFPVCILEFCNVFPL